jgi:hypothetical protein
MARIAVIGAICVLLGFAAGKWWFAAGSAAVVGVVVAITSNVEVSSVFLGALFGSGVFLAMSIGTVLRWGFNWILRARRAREDRT